MVAASDSPGTDFAMVPSEVADAGTYVQQVADSLINGLSSLDRDISGVLDNWRGAAADAFSEGWAETKEGAATVLDALAAMAGLLGAATKAVEGQDISNAVTLRSLDVPELNL
ncbi:WXG100 family type VII secretion target [Nocardia rhizosphaerae]|uniref:WXG100 family type VII secretion target n=1 Tax=Nocardia rhizosphaerae TaxID=1691571 RepID=A0ABV8KZM0_9NOCA